MSWYNKTDCYRPGDYYMLDQRTGFKIRRSEAVREEKTRLWVADPDPRHPQDFVRGRADKQTVSDPSPEPEDVFLEANEITAADL